jgi:hypothetical protein
MARTRRAEGQARQDRDRYGGDKRNTREGKRWDGDESVAECNATRYDAMRCDAMRCWLCCVYVLWLHTDCPIRRGLSKMLRRDSRPQTRTDKTVQASEAKALGRTNTKDVVD